MSRPVDYGSPSENPGPAVSMDDDWQAIEAVLRARPDNELMAGVEKVYSTSEAAEFFNKSNQWLYWGMRTGVFTYPDDTEINVDDPVCRVSRPEERGVVVYGDEGRLDVRWDKDKHIINNMPVEELRKLIEPVRIGKGGRRRFTLPIIREIALACYRRGNLKEPELLEIMRKIAVADMGEDAFAS